MEKFTVEIEYDNFETSGKNFKKGDRFIGLNISGHNRGSGSPCKTREGVIKSVKNYIFDDGYANGEKLDTKESDVELIDKTDLNFKKTEFFGFKQDLGKWF